MNLQCLIQTENLIIWQMAVGKCFLLGSVKPSIRTWMAGVRIEGSIGIGTMLGPFLAGSLAATSLSYTFIVASLSGLLFVAGLRIDILRRARRESD